jgi:hypothetical protein
MKKINILLLPLLITLLLTSTKVISQENSILEIAPELTKKICENNDYDIYKLIYPVSHKEVDFPVYDTTQVITREYKKYLSSLEKYKPGYDSYLKNSPNKRGIHDQFDYEDYLRVSEKLKTIQKTQTGKVLTNKTTKKLVYLVGETPIDLENFSGTFYKMPGEYVLVPSDFEDDYVKNELTTDFKDFYNDGSNARFYPLIKKKDTEELFYVLSKGFLSNLENEQSFTNLFNNIHKLGYKEYKDEYGDYFIKSKTCEIKLDTWTISELKLNPSYITTLDNDQIKIAALVKQTIPHSKILDKYLGLYRIQRNKMSSIDINNWRTATGNAQKLHNQIYRLSEKYSGNYSFTLINKSDTQEVFSENLIASKGVLGM